MLGKLRSTAGESITESLVGMLIASLAFVFLVSAIVVAAKVNASLTNEDTSFSLGSVTEAGSTVDVALSVEGDVAGDYQTTYEGKTVYVSDNQKYYYYE